MRFIALFALLVAATGLSACASTCYQDEEARITPIHQVG